MNSVAFNVLSAALTGGDRYAHEMPEGALVAVFAGFLWGLP